MLLCTRSSHNAVKLLQMNKNERPSLYLLLFFLCIGNARIPTCIETALWHETEISDGKTDFHFMFNVKLTSI